jgi:hypothetical protein
MRQHQKVLIAVSNFFACLLKDPSGFLDAIEYNQLMEAKSQLDQLPPVPCNC